MTPPEVNRVNSPGSRKKHPLELQTQKSDSFGSGGKPLIATPPPTGDGLKTPHLDVPPVGASRHSGFRDVLRLAV